MLCRGCFIGVAHLAVDLRARSMTERHPVVDCEDDNPMYGGAYFRNYKSHLRH